MGTLFHSAMSLALKSWKIWLILFFFAFIDQIILQVLGVSQITQWAVTNWIKFGIWFLISTVISTYTGMGYWHYLIELHGGATPTIATFIAGANKTFLKAFAGMVIATSLLLPSTLASTAAAIMAPVLSRYLPKVAVTAITFSGLAIGIILFGVAVWLAIKIALWIPSMLYNNTGPLEGMKNSFRLTTNNLLRIFVLLSLPLGIASGLARVNAVTEIQLLGEILKFFVLPVVIPPLCLMVYHSLGKSSVSAQSA